ncbi:dTTP/UTP pyrophosphatase [Sulfidibacter corallicola]|uniref:dTTP/UTP pyrophosphatase n=1 Tax=Sulfidibacter corallicola TaxID=2818388 RepID=A0A8A4TEI6_SULCO|nr:nucleoside triphosphate pyrophosphatase [Sulfidibacter corallicola]QTD48519.1 septum formation protein Maf [Sulfidibacter corallicola]
MTSPSSPASKPFDRESLRLILASQSPRRANLLQQAGYTFETIPSQAEEKEAEFHTVEEVVMENAAIKGRDVVARIRSGFAGAETPTVLVAADTLVAMKGKVYPKPRDLDEAHHFLSTLGGRYHRVYTGVYLYHFNCDREAQLVDATRVMLRKMETAEIQKVFELVNPLDKAGAYGYQDSEWIVSSLIGSETNVIGLPMEALEAALTKLLAN